MYTFCVRAEGGEYADAFVAGGYVAIGWNDIEDLDEVAVLGEQDGLTELEERVKAVAGAFSQKPGTLSTNSGNSCGPSSPMISS